MILTRQQAVKLFGDSLVKKAECASKEPEGSVEDGLAKFMSSIELPKDKGLGDGYLHAYYYYL